MAHQYGSKPDLTLSWLTGIIHDLDASRLSGYEEDDTVDPFVDQSESGADCVLVGTDLVYRDSDLVVPSIESDGSGYYYYSGELATPTQGAVFCVVRPKLTGGHDTIYATANEAVNTSFWQLRIKKDGKVVLSARIHGGTALDYVRADATPLVANTTYLITVSSDGATWRMWINGVLQVLTVVGGSNHGRWWGVVPSRTNVTAMAILKTSLGERLNGWIGQIVHCTPEPTDEEIARANAILMDKWL